jgi:hypothetical protein
MTDKVRMADWFELGDKWFHLGVNIVVPKMTVFLDGVLTDNPAAHAIASYWYHRFVGGEPNPTRPEKNSNPKKDC